MATNPSQSALAALHLFRWICGVAPLDESSYWTGCFKSCVYVLFYLIIMYFVLIGEDFTIDSGNNINRYTSIIAEYGLIIVTVTIVVNEYINRSKIRNTFEKIKEVDDTFVNNDTLLNVSVNYTGLKHHLLIIITALCAANISYIMLSCYYLSAFRSLPSILIVLVLVSYPNFMISVMVTQVSIMLYILRERFIWMNRQLRKLSKAGHFSSTFLPTDSDITIQLKAIHVFRNIYSKQMEVFAKINGLYNISVLLFVAMSFIVAVTQCYEIAIFFTELTLFDTIYIAKAVMSFYWMLIFIIHMMFLVLGCHRTATEAQKTGALLHRMQNRHHFYIRESIKQWSLELLHGDVAFTAGGLFSVNMTLLFAMIGSVTTYLVILIQFNLLSKSGNNKYNST